MLGTMWSRNYTGEAETFVMWSQGGAEICLFLLDQTARMNTKKVSICRGSFGGFETTCFQLDRAASLDSTGMFYFSCDSSAMQKSAFPPQNFAMNLLRRLCVQCKICKRDVLRIVCVVRFLRRYWYFFVCCAIPVGGFFYCSK